MLFEMLIAASVLIPQGSEMKGNVYHIYPGSQQYIYGEVKSVPVKPSLQDGNEEDEYLRAKEKHGPKKTGKSSSSINAKPKEKVLQQGQEMVPGKSMEEQRAASIVPPQRTTEKLLVALFEFDGDKLGASAEERLIGHMGRIRKAVSVEIRGYTDKIGTKEYNDGLARRRAEAVRRFIIANGVQEGKIKMESEGRCCYSSETDSENRRVEVWVTEER